MSNILSFVGKSRIDRVFYYIGVTSIATVFCLIIWTCWSLWYPFQVFEVKPGSFEVMNTDKTVHRGETLYVSIDYCKHAKSSPRIDFLLESGKQLFIIDGRRTSGTFGCFKIVAGLVEIPATLPIEVTYPTSSGKAKLRVTYTYRINALRDIEYQFVTDEFVILP